MGIVSRLKNAYHYGGITEITRKAVFYTIYSINSVLTSIIVKQTEINPGLNIEERKDSIVVSLTTFPLRFNQIGLCLKSLLIQELKPDRIIVYLGSDCTPAMLTPQMEELKKFGIEYRFDEQYNLMPHKKYLYAMQEFPKSIVVTADDDTIYPRNWLRTLYDSYKKYPEAISARRVHYIQIKDRKLLPYDHWIDQYRRIRTPSKRLIATGNAGVLYPPNCFDSEAFNKEAIQELCLRADDLWLKCMEIRNNRPVVWVKNWQVMPATIDESGNKSLKDENTFTGTNDRILSGIMSRYSITAEDFM